jgi:LPS-assembly protein
LRYCGFILSFCFILLVLYPTHTSHAKIAELKAEEGETIDIEADELIYDREQQLYHANGQVEVIRGDLSLKAEHAQLNMATKELVAWGNVLLREGEDVLECERLEVNLNTRLGKIYRANLFLKDQNFHITGREMEKLGENVYRIRDGSFTTCDAERPPWKFTVKELEVTQGGSGIAKGSVLYLEDIPVLYFPWGSYPITKDRQTGFLFPRVVYSNDYGLEVKTAFFWAMRKDMDSTLYLDYLGKRGFKEGLEYRYAFTRDIKGKANFYFIDDQVYDNNRYAFFVQHDQKLPYGFYLKGDINYVSDNQYIRDFDEDLPWGSKIDSRSSNQLRSNVFGGKNWDQYSLLTDAEFFQDLTQESNEQTVQKLPQISFYAHPQSLFKTPFFWDLTSSYTNFWRQKGLEASRWDLFPTISYPVRLLDVLKLESSVGARETLYRPRNDPTNQLNEWKSRETFVADAEMSTEFYRVYDAKKISKISSLFGMAKWMHTIEPMVSYQYIPRVNQNDLPIFDEVDRIPYTNQITYGITQRLVGRPEKVGVESGPYEYARLNIFQSYSLGDPFEKDSSGRGRYFSDIQAQFWWNFGPYATARIDAGLSPYEWQLNTLNALVNIRDRRNDALQVQYLFTRDNIQQLNLDLRVVTIPSLYLFGSIRYNLLEKFRVESIYGVQYQAQCWILSFVVDDINGSPDGTQKKELKYEFRINLVGVGALGRKPYFLGL